MTAYYVASPSGRPPVRAELVRVDGRTGFAIVPSPAGSAGNNPGEEKMKPVIPPTIGRRVLVFLSTQPAGVSPNNPKVPYDGGISYVWGDSDPVKNTINVGFNDHDGNARSATSVQLYDRPQNEDDKHGNTELGNYAVWMPYQFEQALRATAKKPVGDVELVKLADGDQLTEAGRERVNAELAEQEQSEREQRQDDTARAVGEDD